jgi:hypothetical protein
MLKTDWDSQSGQQVSLLCPPLCEKVIMREEETLDGAIENNNLYVLISFECSDNLFQLRNGFRPKDALKQRRHALR